MVKKIVCLALMLVFVHLMPISALAATPTISEKLKPYQTVVEELNAELHSNISIPNGSEEKVYNNIKGMTPAELKKVLRKEYIDLQKQQTKNSETDTVEKEFEPFSIREEGIDYYPIQYNSLMYLDAIYFSATGAAGSFVFDSILDYGAVYDSNYTGYHFEVSSGNYSLSSDRKSCLVNLTGTPVDAYGFSLTIVIHASHTFTSN